MVCLYLDKINRFKRKVKILTFHHHTSCSYAFLDIWPLTGVRSFSSDVDGLDALVAWQWEMKLIVLVLASYELIVAFYKIFLMLLIKLPVFKLTFNLNYKCTFYLTKSKLDFKK